MVTSDIKLIGAWASPYVNRVQIALNLKSLSYEFLQEEFGKKSDLLLKSNPVHKKIPVLIHGDKPVCESLIIVEYIDEEWGSAGPGILPSDPYDRAIARFWGAFVDDKLLLALKDVRLAEGAETKEAAAEWMREMLALLEEAFTECSGGKAYFGGDVIGYVDIAFGSFLGWLKAAEKLTEKTFFDEKRTPKIVGWSERFLSHEAVKDVMPEVEKLLEVAKMYEAMAKP